MSKFRNIKNSFIGGEISPTALGRTDLPFYSHACEQLLNMIPILSGGVYRRPGTIYEHRYTGVTAPKLFFHRGADGTNRMVDSHDTVYAPQSTARYYKHIPGENAVTRIDVSTYTDAELETVRTVQSADIMWVVCPTKKPALLKHTGSGAYSLVPFDDGLTGEALRDAWPYGPKNTTAITATTVVVAGAFGTIGSTIDVTFSDQVFKSGDAGSMVKHQHTGVYGCFLLGAVTEGAAGTPQTIRCIVKSPLGGTTATADWWPPAWSNAKGWPAAVSFFKQRLGFFGTSTYPDSGWFSGMYDYFQLSKDAVLDPNENATGTDPFTYTLGGSQLSKINWAKQGKKLFLGTEDNVWSLDAATQEGFQCGNVAGVIETDHGSNGVVAESGSEMFFVTRDGTEVRSLIFSDEEDAYVADYLQIFYPDFPAQENKPAWQAARKIVRLVWDETRKTLWALDSAGNLKGLTREKRLSVSGWHSHQLGGYDSSVVRSAGERSGTHWSQYVCTGGVVDICAGINPTTKQTDLWLVTTRKVDGTWYFMTERMSGGWINASSIYSATTLGSDLYFTDCTSQTWDVAPGHADVPGVPGGAGVVTVDTGVYKYAFHLAGKTVTVNVASTTGLLTLPPVTVGTDVDATTTLTGPLPSSWGDFFGPGYMVAFGLPFTSKVKPVRLNPDTKVGTSQAAIKRVNKATIRFYKTMAAKVGRDENNLSTVEFRTPTTPMGSSAEMFSGDKTLDVDCDYDRDGYLVIMQDQPLPFAVISVISEGMTYDG